MIEVEVVVRVKPTEDPDKVLDAVKKLFPDLEYRVKEGLIVGRGRGIEALRNFVNVIGREGIAPRTIQLLRERRRGNSVVIPIDKEVATVGRISYDEEGEMGPMWLEVRGDVQELEDTIRSLISS